MNMPESVSLKCLFCGLEIGMEESKSVELKSGDQIECNHCKEMNDFDSMVEVAREEIGNLVNHEIEKSFKNIFKS